jgi:V/A-type H+/Na+-transporting ATPase subunit E
VATIHGNPEALVAEVIRHAQHRAAEMAEEARRRAAAILEDAKKESESIRRQSEQAAERQVAAVVRRNSARAELEALRRFITLREEPINRVWRAAEERLRQLVHQPTYRDILKSCALRAARELGAGELVLAGDPVGHGLLSKETLEQWSQEAGVQFRAAPEPATAWGGLLAASGRVRFDATFPTQLALAQIILRERVFQILSKEEH